MDKSGRTDILMKRSTDKGATWTEKNITEQVTSFKTTLIWIRQLWLIRLPEKFSFSTSLWDAVGKPSAQQGYNNRAIMYISEDDGITWTRKDLTDEVHIGIYSGFTRMIGSFGPGSGVQMTNEMYKDRLIVPMRSFKVDADKGTVSNGGNTAMYSDDHGVTWRNGST